MLPLRTCAAPAALLLAASLSAQASITPVAGFGSNGWLDSTSPVLGTNDTERGLACNPLTGSLLLASRMNLGSGPAIRVLDGDTGVQTGTLNGNGAFSQGQLVLNMVDTTADGAIYVCNQISVGTTSLQVHKWDSEAAGLAGGPALVFSSTVGLAQCGDAFAVTGGTAGVPARFAAAGFNSMNAGNFVVGTLDGTDTHTTFLSVPGTNTAGNDYGASLTFVDGNTLIGSGGGLARKTSFSFASGAATVDATIPLNASNQRIVDRTVIGTTPVLAVLNSSNSNVAIYDITDPTMPFLLANANNTTGALPANPLGTGAVTWGPVTGSTARLYALTTNQGIQAFEVTLPPPTGTGFGVGCFGVSLGANGQPSIGNAGFALEVQGLAPNAPLAFVAFGSSALSPGLDLTAVGMAGCFAYTSFDLGLYATAPQSGGIAAYALPIPADPLLAGSQLTAQGVAFSSATTLGLSASNGALLTFGF